jgi:hypothetical protein
MKTMIRKLTLCAMLGAAMSAQGAIQFLPNGDFSSGGANWAFAQANGHTVDYPATGGNTGGHAVINGLAASQTWFAVLIANGDAPMSLGSLGLQAGKRYKFLIDMKRLAGANIGGLKLDFSPSGSTGDTFKPLIGDGSTWETYEFQFDIPPGVTALKVVPLWGSNSQVGYDNVRYDNTPVPIIPVVPNGNFEIPGGNGWGTTQGTPSFPIGGGNPDGNAVLDGTAGFSVLYAFNNTEKTFASLGLAPGDSYTLQVDMKLVSGSNIGGIRLEGPAAYVLEQYPAIIGDGSQWATYSIPLTVPTAPAQAKFGLRPGAGSVVAFDNVKIIPPGPPPPFTANIEKGTVVGWAVGNVNNTYQPQKRNAVEDAWVNIGSPVPGTSVPYIFEQTPSNFYQVIEAEPFLLENAVQNPGFETAGSPPLTPAANWNTLSAINGGSATALGSYTGGYTPHTGAAMLVLESATGPVDPVPAPNVVVRSDNFAVVGGTSYNLSFWAAHVEKTGGANPQFSLFFFNEFNGVIGGPTFVSFASIGNTWTQVQHSFTAPAGAVAMNVGWTHALGAAANWKWVTLLDDVELLTPTLEGNSEVIPATAGPGVEVSWQSVAGRTYQVRTSGNLVDWTNFGSSVVGNGSIYSVADPISPPGKKFYRVGETP